MFFQMSLLNDLREKQEILREDYQSYFLHLNLTPEILNHEEQKLFASMSRWHENSHVTEEEWTRAFENISDNLDVRENMPPMNASFAKFLRYLW